MNEILKTVEEFIVKHRICGNVLIGFSGGVDSMCLADIMHRLSASHKINLTAVHLNHNWRGKDSLQDEINCKNFCQELGINFYSETLSDDIPHTETAARDARYKFFEKCAQKFNSKTVLTAHTASDNAETVLYRIFKGTGTIGLEGIKEVRGIYYRPLIGIYREQIEEYCKTNNLTPNIDKSNFDIKYKRNFLRYEILEKAKEINPDAAKAVNSLSTLSKETNSIAEEYLEIIKTQVKNDDIYNTSKFIEYSHPVQNRLIYDIFQEYKLDYDYEKITGVRRFIEENAGSKSGNTLSLSNKLMLFVSTNTIKIIKPEALTDFSIDITHTGNYETPYGTFIITEATSSNEEVKKKDEFYVCAEIADINFTIRTRREGDIIQPLGMKGHQKLKKYLNEKKIPNHEKDKIVLLAQGKEILWAAGIGISEKIKVDKKCTHVLKFIRKEGANGN